MRVLIFLTQFHQLGGAERLAIELAEGLNERGVHADILSQYSVALPGVAKAKIDLLRRGIPAVYFLGMEVHPTLLDTVWAVRKLRRFILENEYDIVETSMVMPSAMTAWAAMGTGVKQVAGIHQVFRLDRENSIKHKLWRFSIRINPRIHYYAISDFVAQAWRAYSGAAPEATSTIYNGITDESFEAAPSREEIRSEFGLPDEARIALYVGRLAAYKGIDTALEALGPILDRENLYLLFVGQPNLTVPGTEVMLQRMMNRIHREGWSSRVLFLNFRSDVPRLMASSDILVHPARMEGFGLVLAEALATGLPVVATDVEGIPEVLRGTLARIVPPDDANALRAAVVETLTQTAGEKAMAEVRGRERAEAFRSSKRVEALIDLFERLTNRGVGLYELGSSTNVCHSGNRESRVRTAEDDTSTIVKS